MEAFSLICEIKSLLVFRLGDKFNLINMMKIKAIILFTADLVNIFSCLPGNNGPLLCTVGQHHNVSRLFCYVCWGFLGKFATAIFESVIKDNPLPVFTLCHITRIGLLYILLSSRKHMSLVRGNRVTQWQHKRKRTVENKPTRQRGILKSYQGVDKLIGMSFEMKEPHRSPAEVEAGFGFTLSMIFTLLLLFICDVASACLMMCLAGEE